MDENWKYLTTISHGKHREIYNSSKEEKLKFLETYKKTLEDTFFAPEYKSLYFEILLDSLISKVDNIRRIEKKRGMLSETDLAQNIEGALKSGFYTCIRNIYNQHIKLDSLKVACFYFLRDYCFSSMFRYNSKGGFNVPYGGMSYNDRSPACRVKYWRSELLIKHLQSTDFFNLDFEEFMRKTKPTSDDFIFIDPPYDSEFSTYAKNAFTAEDQKRLANYLLNECDSKFLAIMKNTEFIRGLYEGKKKNVKCLTFDKTYAVSFKNRNERSVEHLIVVRS
jgi:DNA adenine methylase